MPHLPTVCGNSTQSLLRLVAVATGLILLAGCSAEKGDWKRAQSENSADAYRLYVEKHPDSAFAAEARQKWEALDYAVAEKVGTADALASFLSTHPAGAHADQARGKRSMLTNKFSIETRPVRQMKKQRAIFQGDWYVKDPDKNTGIVIHTKFHVTEVPMDLGLHDFGISYVLDGKREVEGCSGAGKVGEDGEESGMWLFRDPEKGESFTMKLNKDSEQWSLVFALPQAAKSMVILYKDQEISREFEMTEFPAKAKE